MEEDLPEFDFYNPSCYRLQSVNKCVRPSINISTNRGGRLSIVIGKATRNSLLKVLLLHQKKSENLT